VRSAILATASLLVDLATPVRYDSCCVVLVEGTAFSGYAFSFTHETTTSSSSSSSPTTQRGNASIHMMGKWEGCDPGIINQKTPTTLLLTPQGQVGSKAMGFNLLGTVSSALKLWAEGTPAILPFPQVKEL